MNDSVERFSNRVENYVKYRPTYPRAVLELFKTEMGLTAGSIVADIGSGPGISARLFLENGNHVYCVEPNAAMREAAETAFQSLENFHSIDGNSGATMLPDDSVDFVTASQAFHWFKPEPTRKEFLRILRPGGYVVLIWNERQLDTTPFLREYEQFILEHAKDYSVVRHENITSGEIYDFFRQEMHTATFDNRQIFDFEGLKGRLLSASYIPLEGDPSFPGMVKDLEMMFAKHSEQGRITILYTTSVYYSRF